MASHYNALRKAADYVAARLGRASIGAVMGSGLSECMDNLDQPRFLDYASIPGMPVPSTVGHRGALVHGHHDGVSILALCGRIHVYEGRPNHEVAMPIRLLSLLGVHSLVVTSAVGSLDPELKPGQIMLVDDHINLSGTNVLAGDFDPHMGPRFVDLSDAYDPNMATVVEETARMAGIPISRGVLVQFLGPGYETPAEVRMARTLGGRVVSMSMVPDVLVARQRGMRVAGLACVTNMAAGLAVGRLSHEDVLKSSAVHTEALQMLVTGTLPRLAGQLAGRPS